MDKSDIDFAKMDGPELLRYCGMDAQRWAAAFNQTAKNLGYSDMDEGWLIGWFANAIMNTYDIITGQGPVVLDDGSAFFVATLDTESQPV
jgi:hypothetical protein